MTDQNPLAIAVTGVSGRMGQMLVAAIAERDDAVLAGATERPGHPWIGRDLGEAMGGQANGVTVSDDPLEVFAGARAVLDFTAPAGHHRPCRDLPPRPGWCMSSAPPACATRTWCGSPPPPATPP